MSGVRTGSAVGQSIIMMNAYMQGNKQPPQARLQMRPQTPVSPPAAGPGAPPPQARAQTQTQALVRRSQAQARQVRRVQASARQQGEVLDTHDVSMCGLQHWYKSASQQVAGLAAMQDGHTNRGKFSSHLMHSLSQLIEALDQRKLLLADMPSDQAFDLNIMTRHVQQLIISVTRLNVRV